MYSSSIDFVKVEHLSEVWDAMREPSKIDHKIQNHFMNMILVG